MAAKKSAAKKTSRKASKKTVDQRFAVIESGGKQYTVGEGDVISINPIRDTEGKNLGVGDAVTFDTVLLVDDGATTQIGDPHLAGARVDGTVTETGKGKKVDIVRFKSKSRHLRRKGHRQLYMKVKISAIK